MSEYVAFSLAAAQELVCAAQSDWRVSRPDLLHLSGMTKVCGLVQDVSHGDLILVGLRVVDRPSITLDDLAVALRARFVHSDWPSVSIDPAPDTEDPNTQVVRFCGGIQDTQLGKALFDADFLLKQFSLGLWPTDAYGIDDPWAVAVARARASKGVNRRCEGRFWLYPISPSVAVRKDVASVGNFRVGVFTEVLHEEVDGQVVAGRAESADPSRTRFAEQLTANYGIVSKHHPEFALVQTLSELVALSRALEEMGGLPELSFWLRDYQVPKVPTPQKIPVLRHGDILDWPHSSFLDFANYALRHMDERCHYLELSGGVVLTALAARIRAGDVAALRDAALLTRPHPRALSWSFVVADWVLPTSAGTMLSEDLISLYLHASFLQEQRRYDDAASCYDAIVRNRPDWALAYMDRGSCHAGAKRYDLAVADYDAAIRIASTLTKAYYNRGTVLSSCMRQYARAIDDFDRAISLDPYLAEAYNNRGIAYIQANQEWNKAIVDFEQALSLNPDYPEAHNSLGLAYKHRGLYDLAITSFDKAIAARPGYAEAHNHRGLCRAHLGQHDEALADYNRAIALNPSLAEAFLNRVNSHFVIGEFELAAEDCDRAIQLRIASVKPEYAVVYFNKALVCEKLGRIQEAIRAYRAFVECAPAQFHKEVAQARGALAEMERRDKCT